MVERCSSQREKWGVIDMLEITDRFKAWMRGRLADHSYAECIFQALIDEEDATLLEVWPHAALPMKSTLDDPEAMIGMLKGYDNAKGVDIIVAIFGQWEDFKDLSRSYFSIIWGMQDPMGYRDFESLPNIYEVAFAELGEETEPIQKRRWTVEVNKDGEVSSIPYDENKLNLINTSVDSGIIKIICGEV